MRGFVTFRIAVGVITFALMAALPAGDVVSRAGSWDFDSINPVHPATTANQVAGSEVYAAILQSNALWNAHDLEGYLSTFWRSPSFVFIEDNAVISGWQEFHDRSVRGFNRPETMGKATTDRVQVRMVSLDYAYVVTHWTMAFSTSSHAVVGIDSACMQRIDGVWKTVNAHTSYLEM